VKSPDPSHDRTIETLQVGMTASRRHMSGTDRYYQDLLAELPRLGIGVRGMVVGEPDQIEDAISGIESFAPEGSGRIARARGARRVASRLLPGTDLVVAHGVPHVFYIVDKLGNRPFVAHFHGPWSLEGKREGASGLTTFTRKVQEAVVYRRAQRYIALSRAFADTLQSEYAVNPDHVRVIPGGVNLERFTVGTDIATARKKFGWPEDRPIVLATRRLEPSKGIGALIEAMASVRARVPNVLAIVTGTGSLAEALRLRTLELGLGDHVRFAGHVASAELPLMYRAADLTIVPSNAWEGFGLSVLESLACATPALVTPVGGLPEVVGGLSSKLILRDVSAEAIAEGLTMVFTDRGSIPSRAACEAYARGFTWTSIARRVADVYREVATPQTRR
jgi:glycosyltransferase involved in cell wall biosynthesis